MEELTKILEKTVSASQVDQNEAIRYIQEYICRDFTGFLKTLSDVLYNQQNPPIVRAAAGLQLKNQLTARDDQLRIQQQERWRRLSQETKQYVKERVFRTLGTEIFRPSSAPQCVAYIAIAEVHEGQWPTFIEALVQSAKNPASTDKMKLDTLESIGYICQEVITGEHQQVNRKKDITNGLNASMTTIYAYLGDCINSRNYDLMTTALQCLTGILTWAQVNKDLLSFLCQLLRRCDMLQGHVPNKKINEQELTLINSTCDCLNACLERKHSKMDSLEVRASLYEDLQNLRSIISALDKLSQCLAVQQDPCSISESLKKLSQVLTNIMRYVYICPPEKREHLLEMYSIMKVIIAHPSISVSIEGVRFWNRVAAVAPKKPNPTIDDDLTASLLITCANKLIRANYDSQIYGYEFDCQQDFDNFQNKYRGEVCDLCRNLTQQNDRICFELVSSSIAKSIQQRSLNLNEWDALSSLSAAVCAKLKDPSVFVANGVELIKALMISMDGSLVQASSMPPDVSGSDASLIADLVSNQLSCVSALYVFLPYWHQNDKELTKELLKKIILYAFHRPDKFNASSRQLVGSNTNLLSNELFLKGFRLLSRHASASFVRVCLNHSKHILNIFSDLKDTIDCLFNSTAADNPFSSEKCQLYEGLTLICNEEPDELMRKKFILELFESIRWFQNYELECDQFIEFVGLNRLEPEHDGLATQTMISQTIPASQLNRVKLSYVISFIGAITKRINSRVTLLPEVLSFVKPILNIIYTMHALWIPEMKAKCVKEYQQFLYAPFDSAYKQQILETILVNQRSDSGYNMQSETNSSTIGDMFSRPTKGNGQYIELFSWNFYDSLLSTMGAIINKTSPDLFNYIDASHFQAALTGAEYLPPLKMHKLIKYFIMPLVNNCSKDQQLIQAQLLPLLSKLLPFLFDMLDSQWKAAVKDDESGRNGAGDNKLDQSQILADEMVQDQLLRNLSRDFIDLMNLILVETVPNDTVNNQAAHSNTLSNHSQNSAPRQTQQDLYKIGMLGLNLLSAGPDFIMKVMATSLTWSDSTLNAKAIFVNQQLIKHILASSIIKSVDEASIWLGCMFTSVITSLRMFGEHEQNCSGLLTLFLHLYDNLNKTIPNFHDHLEKMTGISKGDFQRFDQEAAKSSEKTKRSVLRRVLDSLVRKI